MARNRKALPALSRGQQDNEFVGAQGKDFSGLDLLDISVEDQNFFESIFNGCLFGSFRASQSIFQHAEFTETVFSNCFFEDTSFDHSDFVLTNVSESEFIRCSFQNAEWRDTLFDAVRFRQCIFRNTTTSLTHFVGCWFDDASAASFIGRSKRFSLFSNTRFRLPREHVDFLRSNFGILAPDRFSAPVVGEDPLFQLSLRRFAGELSSQNFYHLILKALFQITSSDTGPHRLRLRYISDICRVYLEERSLSVFAIQLLHGALSCNTSLMRDRNQSLELFSCILTLRVALRERVTAVEEDVVELHAVGRSKLHLQMEFENSYNRELIEDYVDQLIVFCGLSTGDVVIDSLRQGSTFTEILLIAPVLVADVFRFVRYSLSLATVTLNQAGKVRRAYSNLTASPQRRTNPRKRTSKTSNLTRKVRKELVSESITKEITGAKLEDARAIEIFVDTAKERVLILDGRVKVTISIM